MSIAKIITDAFREDKFGHEFISHSEERLQAMNDAQLAGVERFLLPMIANSKIHYIRDAFRELEGKTRVILNVRESIQEQRKKEEQSVDSRQYVQRQKKLDRESERDLIMDHLEKKAFEQANEEMKVFERERFQQEKKRMIDSVPVAEKKRKDYAISGVAMLVVAIIAAIVCDVVLNSVLFMACALGGGFLFSTFLFRQAYLQGIIKEIVVPQAEIDGFLERRQQEIIDKGMREFRERERHIRQKEREEKEYRKKYRAERKREREEAAKVLEAERLEFLKLTNAQLAAANLGAAMRVGSPGGSRPGSTGPVLLKAEEEYEGYFDDLPDIDKQTEEDNAKKIPKKVKKGRHRTPVVAEEKAPVMTDADVENHEGEDEHNIADEHSVSHVSQASIGSADDFPHQYVMRVNIMEISCINMTPIINDGSYLYAKVLRAAYHVPRGKRHRVAETSVILSSDPLANVRDEVSWSVANAEKKIEISSAKVIEATNPNDDFVYDETKTRLKPLKIKAQSELFSSAFDIGDEEELIVLIIRQFIDEREKKKKKVIKEEILGTATIVGAAIREFQGNHNHFDCDFFVVRDIAREDVYGFASIHFTLNRRFLDLDYISSMGSVTSLEVPSQDFHYDEVEIQEAVVTLLDVSFNLSQHVNKDTQNVYLSVELKAPNLGFFGPVVKHHGFRHNIGPEEKTIETTETISIHHIEEKSNMTFHLASNEGLRDVLLTMEHSLCFILDEEMVTLNMDDDHDVRDHTPAASKSQSRRPSKHEVKSNTGSRSQSRRPSNSNDVDEGASHMYSIDRIGEQFAKDLESGFIKERNIVFTNNYIGGYEIPLQTIINIGTDNENLYNISGILVDENQVSCGLIEFTLKVVKGKFYVRQTHHAHD